MSKYVDISVDVSDIFEQLDDDELMEELEDRGYHYESEPDPDDSLEDASVDDLVKALAARLSVVKAMELEQIIKKFTDGHI